MPCAWWIGARRLWSNLGRSSDSMDIIYLLIPITLVLAGLMVWALMWAIKSGQFDDLEGPAHQILMDDDEVVPTPESSPAPAENKKP